MSDAIYPIAVVQFFLGAIIAAINVLVLAAILANRKLRSASYFLCANFWFANLLLGVIVTVSNVVDNKDAIALEKSEGTVAIINCLATLATFLTISTARMVSVKTPHHQMTLRSVTKILVCIWAGVFCLILIKSIVFALKKTNHDACYQCLLGFEAALLVIFAVATVLLYGIAMYLMCVHKKSSVQDSSGPPPAVNLAKEYRDTCTLGLLLLFFLVPFFLVVVLLVIYTFDQKMSEEDSKLVATEAIFTIFYTHCIVNPLILLLRDSEVAKTVKRIILCQRPNDEPYQRPMDVHAVNGGHLPPVVTGRPGRSSPPPSSAPPSREVHEEDLTLPISSAPHGPLADQPDGTVTQQVFSSV